jgi:hypothetical protein
MYSGHSAPVYTKRPEQPYGSKSLKLTNDLSGKYPGVQEKRRPQSEVGYSLLVDHVCHCIHAMPRRSVKNILSVIFLCTNARHIMSLKSIEKLTYLLTLFLRIDCVEFIFKYQGM